MEVCTRCKLKSADFKCEECECFFCSECDTYMVYQGVISKDYKLYKKYVCPNCGKIEYLLI